jgi:FtsP/CotA-like multicopper oxidase with cupredoxin domain
MSNAGIQFNLELEMANDSDCEWWIVARDGVYLDEPIQENGIFLPPASRMDVVFRCHTVGSTWMWNNASNPDRDWLFETFFGNYMHRMRTVQVLEFNVVEPEEEQSEDISPETYFVPERPNYLSSLLDVPESDLNGTLDIVATSVDHPGYNYEYYSGLDVIFYTMYLDKVYQFSFTSTYDIGVHPTHVHLNHMQIVSDIALEDTQWTTDKSYFTNNPAYRVGEWRDTVHVMPGRGLSVRFRTDTFTGKIPMHCHYFVHSDKGMFVILEILNDEEELDDESGLDSEN